MVKSRKFSIRKAAKLNGIPESTLRRYLKKGTVEVRGLGSTPLLPADEEKLLMEHILNMAKMGTILSRSEIVKLATNTAVFLGIKGEFSNPLSFEWYRCFINRWPKLKELQKSEKPLDASQEAANNYFEALKAVVEKYDLTEKPHFMFYFDETSFHVECEPSCTSASRVGELEASVDANLTTTVMAVGSAVGQYIPPYFICNGSQSVADFKDSVLPGSCYCVTDSGCSNGELFLDFLENHLLKYIPVRPDGQCVLLLYHCQTGYISRPLCEHALLKNIILFGLPPQSGAHPQPQTITSFDGLKNAYLTEFQAQMSENLGELTQRHQLCKLVAGAYLHAFTPQNLISAFTETGIYPTSKRKIQLLYSDCIANNLPTNSSL